MRFLFIFFFTVIAAAGLNAQSVIVDDIQFGNVLTGTTSDRMLSIKNFTDENIYVMGVDISHPDLISTDLPEISFINPLEIENNSIYYAKVSFTPKSEGDYYGNIVFHFENSPEDSVCEISATVIKPGIVTNSYNWGRRIIKRDAGNYQGPYAPDNNYGVIYFRNFSSEDITIDNVAAVDNINAEAFDFQSIIDKSTGLMLKPNQDTIIDVFFDPAQLGEYKLTLKFEQSNGAVSTTELIGIGVLPQITSESIDMPPAIAAPDEKSVVKNLVIKNIDYEWSYNATIEDIMISPDDGSVSTDGETYGSLGFMIDKEALKLPRKIKPSDSLVIPVHFHPQHIGDVSFTIITKSDAEEDVAATINASGISKFLEINTNKIKTCINKKDTISVEIKNLSGTELNIFSAEFSPQIIDAVWADLPEFPITIPLDEAYIFDIIYMPLTENPRKSELILTTDYEKYPIYKHEIEFAPQVYRRTIELMSYQQAANTSKPYVISVLLQPGDDMLDLQIDEFNISISYDPAVLSADKEMVLLGEMLSERAKLEDLQTDSNAGMITFRLAAEDDYFFNQAGQLAEIHFDVISEKQFSRMEVFCYTDNTCLQIIPKNLDFTADVDEYSYDQADIYFFPNPASNNNLALMLGDLTSSGALQVEIFDAAGTSVAQNTFSEEETAGDYIQMRDLDLVSGFYICRVQSQGRIVFLKLYFQ